MEEFILVIPCLLFVFWIALLVNLVKKSNQESQRAQQTYQMILQKIPSNKQMLFVTQYDSVKKEPTTAVVLALFFGGLGAHKFYLGQTGLGILYLVFSWTWIPAFIGILEAFTLSSKVSGYNEQKAQEIAAMLGVTDLGPIPALAAIVQAAELIDALQNEDSKS